MAPSNGSAGQRGLRGRRCIGCHGVQGDGRGPSAVFLDPKPRDFKRGIFKFHSTPGKDSLPIDADLFITITHGLWGTAMPTWQDIPDRERFAVIQYIKTFSDRWKKEAVGEPISVSPEPPLTEAIIQDATDRKLERSSGPWKWNLSYSVRGRRQKENGSRRRRNSRFPPITGRLSLVWGKGARRSS